MAIGLGALGGSLVGATGEQGPTQTMTRNVAPQSAQGQTGTALMNSEVNNLENMGNAIPYLGSQQDAYGANQSLAQLFQQYAQGGYLPNQQQIQTANDQAKQMFAPQQTALNQNYQQSQYQEQQQAALMGRSPNDPVLQAKMQNNFMNANQMLGAQQGSYANRLAMQMPQQRLNYQQQYTGVLNGLASQAMANHQALFNLGNSLQSNDQNYRIASSGTTSTSNTPGSFGGAIAGFTAGSAADTSQMTSMIGALGQAAGGMTKLAGA